MAKKASDPGQAGSGNADAEEGRSGSVSSYFRKFFKTHKKLLKERSNEAALEQWLRDHPEELVVPESVKHALANIKSLLRAKLLKKASHPVEFAEPAAESGPTTRASLKELEKLEGLIDECMILVRYSDPEGLANVFNHLRRARNEVVWRAKERG